MDHKDRISLSRMNKSLTIYRGLSAKTKSVAGKFIRNGFSWTLNQEKAAWFARRFDGYYGKPFVAEAKIQKDDIIAYLTDRSEDEILVLPRSVNPNSITELQQANAA